MDFLRKVIAAWIRYRLNDPVYKCEVYKTKGCSHVDGFLCNMKTCDIILEEIYA